MLGRFQTDVVDLNPKFVVILAGTAGTTTADALAKVEHDIPEMVKLAYDAGIKVVLCTVPPTAANDYNPTRPALLQQLTPWIRTTFGSDPRVTLAEIATPMTGEDGYLIADYTVDGVHFSDAGYAVMTPIVAQAIATAMGQQ